MTNVSTNVAASASAQMIAAAPTVPANDPLRPHAARIVSIRPEVAGIATYELELDDPATRDLYRFRPGQFNMLYLPGIGEAAISISSDPGAPERLLHTVRAVGNVTQALARQRVNDRILLRGPFGSAWPVEDGLGCDVILAAGGLGLPPLRPAIHELMRNRGDFGRVLLLYGARKPADLLYTDEYETWRNAGIEIEVTVDLGDANWTGHIGVVPTLFDRVALDAGRTRLFTCGPEIMMRFVIYEALDRGVAAEHAFLSIERNMNCAVGFCGHCQLGPAFACKEGPVFTWRRMGPFVETEEF
ncbi:MAG: FAD/NAD(P)-binding protein [Planctomycetales bacterium]